MWALIIHHPKVMGLVHRLCTYKIFVSTFSISRDINFLIFLIILSILENYFKCVGIMAAMGDITTFATCASFRIFWDSQKICKVTGFPRNCSSI